MTLGLTIYLLVWPIAVAGVMFFIARGFFREWAEARREGRMLI